MNDHYHYNQQDRSLIDRVLAGDTGAFRQIIHETEGLVAQIVYKMISNKEDRKDIAQEVYLKAFKNLASFRLASRLSTWIGRIAYNTCLNHLEKKKFILVDNVDVFDKLGDTTQTVARDQKDSNKIIGAAIEKLSPVLKTMITLYHTENLTYAEIQDITHLPEGTIKSYLFRARKALKESLLQHYKKEEL